MLQFLQTSRKSNAGRLKSTLAIYKSAFLSMIAYCVVTIDLILQSLTFKLLPHHAYNFWTFAFLKACTLLSPLGIKSCACLRAPRLTQRTLTYPQLGRFTAHTERSSNQFSFTPTEINTHTSTYRAYEHSPPTPKER